MSCVGVCPLMTKSLAFRHHHVWLHITCLLPTAGPCSYLLCLNVGDPQTCNIEKCAEIRGLWRCTLGNKTNGVSINRRDLLWLSALFQTILKAKKSQKIIFCKLKSQDSGWVWGWRHWGGLEDWEDGREGDGSPKWAGDMSLSIHFFFRTNLD